MPQGPPCLRSISRTPVAGRLDELELLDRLLLVEELSSALWLLPLLRDDEWLLDELLGEDVLLDDDWLDPLDGEELDALLVLLDRELELLEFSSLWLLLVLEELWLLGLLCDDVLDDDRLLALDRLLDELDEWLLVLDDDAELVELLLLALDVDDESLL